MNPVKNKRKISEKIQGVPKIKTTSTQEKIKNSPSFSSIFNEENNSNNDESFLNEILNEKPNTE